MTNSTKNEKSKSPMQWPSFKIIGNITFIKDDAQLNEKQTGRAVLIATNKDGKDGQKTSELWDVLTKDKMTKSNSTNFQVGDLVEATGYMYISKTLIANKEYSITKFVATELVLKYRKIKDKNSTKSVEAKPETTLER